MNKILVFILSCLVPCLIFADNPLVLTKSPATQEYHVASDSATTAIAVPAPNPPAQTNVTSNINSTGVDTSLQAQLSQLNQAMLLYQQQGDQRIEAMASKNDMIMSELKNLNQVMLELTREVNVLQAQQAALSSLQHVNVSSVSGWRETYFGWLSKLGEANYLDLILMIVLLSLLGFLVFKFRQNTPKNTSSDDTKDEYNFMSTNEAVPAILDLARAYVAMENFSQAKSALQTVLAKGNEAERREAQILFSKIS